MKVLIDADGCPVVDIAVRICKKYGYECILLCDTAHEFRYDGVTSLVFDKGADSVDFALANRIQRDDIALTQDYGLASLCLARGARAIHQDGWEYSDQNIEGLLTLRHEARKHRVRAGRFKGPKKRTPAQDKAFEQAFTAILVR